jgi:hypothetical protein
MITSTAEAALVPLVGLDWPFISFSVQVRQHIRRVNG